MKTFTFLASIVLFFSSACYAETGFKSQIPVACSDDFKAVQERIATSEYKEVTRWAGWSTEDNTMFILYTNEDTQTWTLVQTNGEIVCVISIGEQSKTIIQQNDNGV